MSVQAGGAQRNGPHYWDMLRMTNPFVTDMEKQH